VAAPCGSLRLQARKRHQHGQRWATPPVGWSSLLLVLTLLAGSELHGYRNRPRDTATQTSRRHVRCGDQMGLGNDTPSINRAAAATRCPLSSMCQQVHAAEPADAASAVATPIEKSPRQPPGPVADTNCLEAWNRRCDRHGSAGCCSHSTRQGQLHADGRIAPGRPAWLAGSPLASHRASTGRIAQGEVADAAACSAPSVALETAQWLPDGAHACHRTNQSRSAIPSMTPSASRITDGTEKQQTLVQDWLEPCHHCSGSALSDGPVWLTRPPQPRRRIHPGLCTERVAGERRIERRGCGDLLRSLVSSSDRFCG